MNLTDAALERERLTIQRAIKAAPRPAKAAWRRRNQNHVTRMLQQENER